MVLPLGLQKLSAALLLYVRREDFFQSTDRNNWPLNGCKLRGIIIMRTFDHILTWRS